MPHTTQSILRSFESVQAERRRRRELGDLEDRVCAVKQYQQRRFLNTYRDLLSDARYAPAARFFLDEVYGPKDFSRRDTEFSSIVPALAGLFPQRVVDTLGLLGELHALTELLDSRLAEALPPGGLDAPAYVQAWQRSGEPADREAQLQLVLAVGESIEGHTQVPLLRQTLQLVRRPAEVAGLGATHRLLLAGYDSFRSMGSARPFLHTVAQRERALASRLFAPDAVAALETAPDPQLQQLP